MEIINQLAGMHRPTAVARDDADQNFVVLVLPHAGVMARLAAGLHDRCSVVCFTSIHDALKWCLVHRCRVMLVDLSFPEAEVKDFILQLPALRASLPQLLVVSTDRESQLLPWLKKLGVHELIVKMDFYSDVVLAVLEHMIREADHHELLDNAHREIQRLEKYYQSMIDNAPDGVVLINRQKKFSYISPSAMRILGYTVEELNAVSLLGVSHPDEFAGLQERFEHLVRDPGYVCQLEHRFRRKDGEWIWIESTCSNLFDDPAIEALIVNFRNVSERKQAEKVLLESEDRFRTVFESSSTGKSLTTLDGRLYANKAFCKIVGYSQEELSQMNWRDITHPEDISLNEYTVASILNGEKDSDEWEKRYLHKDGHVVWTEIRTTLIRNDESVPLYFITELADITERKRTEELLSHERDLYLDLVNSQPAGIYRVRYFLDPDKSRRLRPGYRTYPHKVELVSGRFSQITGVSQTELEKEPEMVLDIIHPTDKESFVKASRRANRSFQPFQWEGRLLIGSRIIWVHFESLIRLVNKREILFTGLIYDITDRVQADIALRRSEANLAETQRIARLGSWEWDMATNHIIWSKEMFVIHRTTPAEFTCKPEYIINLIHPEDAPALLEKMRNYLVPGVEFSHEYRIIHEDGSICYMYTDACIESDSYGNPIKMTGFSQDITDRKLVEVALMDKMEELLNFQRLTVDRELRMIELKKEVNEMLEQAGLEAKYKIVE